MLIDDLRILVSATETEYTAAGQTWWTDTQLQDVLDHHRVWAAAAPVHLVGEPVIGGSGTVQYVTGQLGVSGWVEPGLTDDGSTTDWKMMSAAGVIANGAVTLSSDGMVSFEEDQGQVQLEFHGWVYDLNAAAAECLAMWASHVKTAYDFRTDDQQFDRSQAYEQITARAREFLRSTAPKMARLVVGDDLPVPQHRGPVTANMRRTHGWS